MPPSPIKNNSIKTVSNQNYPTSSFNSDTKSILAIEVELKHKLGSSSCSSQSFKARACLDALSHIQNWNPLLAPILQIIQEELELAIYSTQLTSASPESTENTTRPIDKVPWFVLVDRTTQHYEHQVTQLDQECKDVHHKLKLSERDVSLLQKRLLAMKLDMQAQQDSTEQINLQVCELNASLTKNKMELGLVMSERDIERDLNKQKMNELQLKLDKALGTIHSFTQLTNHPDSAHNNTHSADSSTTHISYSNEPINPSPKALTYLSIKQAETLKAQLYVLLNTEISQYELELRRHRHILKLHVTQTVSSNMQSTNTVKPKFIASITEIIKEIALLTDHIDSLKHALRNHERSTEYVELHKYAHATQRKYAITLLFSSDNGASFHSNTTVPYCEQCRERVVACPHLPTLAGTTGVAGGQEKSTSVDPTLPRTIELPKNTTHIQLNRPTLSSHAFLDTDESNDDNVPDDFNVDMKLSNASRFFKVIWYQALIKRGINQPKMPRLLTMDQLLPLIPELYDARSEYEAQDKSNTSSIIELFFKYITDQFSIPAIANRVIFEVLTALESFQESNTDISLFVRHLSGSYSVIWKYNILVNQVITLFEPIDVSKYKLIWETLYPNRHASLYVQLETDLIRHYGGQNVSPTTKKHKLGSNDISKFIKELIAGHTEPNIMGYHRLITQIVETRKNANTLSCRESDFLELVAYAFPNHYTLCEVEACQQYAIAKHDFARGRVSIERCGHILAYLFIHLIHQSLCFNGLNVNVAHLQNVFQSSSKIGDVDDMRRIEEVLATYSSPSI